MPYFNDPIYSYWQSRINTIYLLKDITLSDTLISLLDFRALSFYFIIIKLFNNNNNYINTSEFTSIPVSDSDLRVATSLLNTYFHENSLPYRIDYLNEAIKLTS